MKPDPIPKGLIEIPETVEGRHSQAQSTGRLVAKGPDCYTDSWTFDPAGKVTGWTGRKGHYAEIGDRVIFARHGGVQVPGEDGDMYRILNDEDITGTCSDEIDFTDFRPRTPFSERGKS